MATAWHDRRATQEVFRAVVNTGTAADHSLVAAVTGGRIRVVALAVTAAGTAPAIRFESGAGGTALTGVMLPTSGSVVVLPYNPTGWFETASGAALSMEVGGTSPSIQGVVEYVLVDDDRRGFSVFV